ncbi:hypothetical protein LOZ86_17695 [Pectobacterium parvum]|uniref:Uncharacterized protein n=1 Tax=Pectobacterium parvum TaxID=2778550 RepID=A0AAP9IEZ6_9GAMM|nr:MULTISPECIES: hypothetical protein [Pectobacterium]GKW41394.1 hypothetical protein PEC301879_12530 [Pectobacterium carotovorum subsp. carotovorum]KFX16022.1 hypothetical protein KP17_08080 [Pectobacterium parvum]KHS96428.1 hypothetical protein RC88_07030 [Pectobacterium parvum]MCU1800875.1 hypothetical protein [Pectobacterium parvum]QHQ23043.1 hypothetical protein GMX10_02375 [Pectobacterium parvum]
MSTTKFQVVKIQSGSPQHIDFGTRVLNASVAVQAFELSFGNTDHHLKTISVASSISSFSGDRVTISATCFMEDQSNHKAYGSVNVLVIAECDS